MPLLPFLAYSTAGSLIWTGLLVLAGYLLESQYTAVAEYLDPVSKGIVVIVCVSYFYRLLRGTQRDTP